MVISDKKESEEESLKVKVFVRRNLKMTTNKTAAQVAHSVVGLDVGKPDIIVVLDASDKKFFELLDKLYEDNIKHYKDGTKYHVVIDAGYTEVEAGTRTCVAFVA